LPLSVKASISPEPVRLPCIARLRDAYRRELNCQIVHDSHHERGFVQSHSLVVDGVIVGYGSVNDSGTIKEFYLCPEARADATDLFRMLLRHTHATAIESQSNDVLLMPMLQAFASDVTAETVLFEDGATTALTAPGAAFRKVRWFERPFVFKHTLEPVGDWAIGFDRQVVATGGLLFHYNRPFGDLYMEVATAYRRRGFGAFLVQELKRIARLGGHTPAARCSADNAASQSTLQRAGMRACGHILRGRVAAKRQ
jgi:RimJ/RimL family protein N-acetyltransferase